MTSDFDDDTFQGWTPFLQVGSAEVSLVSTGGNPDGHVHAIDTLGGGGQFGISAPASYLGDLSGLDGLEWDERLLISLDLVVSTEAQLVGADGTTYVNNIAPGSVGSWRTRFAPFTEGSWELSPLSGTASFDDVLQNVTELRINMDVNVGTIPTLESDVDNVVLVPEPGTFAILALGMTLVRRRIVR